MKPKFDNAKVVWIDRKGRILTFARDRQADDFRLRAPGVYISGWPQAELEEFSNGRTFGVVEYFGEELENVTKVNWLYEGDPHEATRVKDVFLHSKTGGIYKPEDILDLPRVVGVTHVKFTYNVKYYDLWVNVGEERVRLGTFPDRIEAKKKTDALHELGLSYTLEEQDG